MALEVDVLIVFADKDNEAQKNELGWVSQFKKFLELMLYQVQGVKSNVVLKSEFDSITASKLDAVGVMVAVLSKDFIASGQCLDTLEAYNKAINGQDNRICKVMKSPLSYQEQPPRLRESIGYDMFQLDTETGAVKEYSDFFSQEAEKQYWMKLVDLAYDINETLMVLKGGAKTDVKNILKRKTIYLAETGHDLSVQRNIIKRELQRYGYLILPNQMLPIQVQDLEKSIKKDLAECAFSIHLVGSAYGEIPEGTEQSVVDIQNQLATEQSAINQKEKKEFSRLIWISPNLKNASERQAAFIESIRRDTEAQAGTEILQTPLEDFKNIMREKLIDVREKEKSEDFGGKAIYLVHDKVDEGDVKPFKDMIEKSGFKILNPAFEGDLLEVRKQHIDNLRQLDGAVIFKGKVNDQWVQMKVLDLLKAPGFGRNKPIKAKAIVATSSNKADLDNYKKNDMVLISGEANKSIESLKMFLQEFNP
ncbi:MAG: hypothetical protein HC811_05155 [Flammeovirgaceae bacterium]|nr:hypothetical protein [Flammeovirgaceae bacterium]